MEILFQKDDQNLIGKGNTYIIKIVYKLVISYSDNILARKKPKVLDPLIFLEHKYTKVRAKINQHFQSETAS